MKLNALFGQKRFITGPGTPDAPLFLPPLVFGNVLPIELRAWRESADGSLFAVDLSTYEISLLVGKSNSRPTLGFWQVTTTEGTSLDIASRATAEEVQAALQGGAFTACTVKGGNGSYVVTLDSGGVWTLPTATFQGNTLSNVLVFEISPGTASTPAQYRIEVLEVAPARIVPANWTDGDTTPVNTFTLVSGNLWRLILDAGVDNGFFTLSLDSGETDFIDYAGGAYAISVALAASGNPATVTPDGTGGYWVNFVDAIVSGTVESQLVILPFSEGNLDLTSTGIRELLDGEQFTDVKITVTLVKDGQMETAAIADAMLVMPINQPATITIDAPQMAGLTFAISDDEAYLEVYRNGTLIGTVALSEP